MAQEAWCILGDLISGVNRISEYQRAVFQKDAL